MSNVKLNFDNGIPSKEIINDWIRDFACFHSPEVIIYKDKNNKFLYIEFDDNYDGVISAWEIFFRKIDANWISLYSYPELGEGEGYDLFYSDKQNRFLFSTSKNVSLFDSLTISKYKFFLKLGFKKDYIRFHYQVVNKNELEIVVNNSIENFYDELINDEINFSAYKEGNH